MKKSIIALMLVFMLALAGPLWAQLGSFGSSSGTQTASDCTVSTYWPIGVLCQDLEDAKLFKGNGTGVTEITAGTGIAADGSVAFTGTPIPNAANTIPLGSNAAEWADIYLGTGAVIYGENDSSNTITSSATGWIFALPISLVSTGVRLTGANGVLTVLGQGDGFDENMTLDFNTTTNLVTIASGTSATFAFTPQVTFTANPRIYDGDSHYLTLDVANLSADATVVIGSNTNNLTLANGTANIDIAAGITADINANLTVNTALTVQTGAVTLTGNSAGSTLVLPSGSTTLGTMSTATATNYVANSLYDAFSILYADTDDTPAALTVGASTIVGRKSSGGIVALTATEAQAILSVDDLVTLSGVATGAVNLGTFTGSTISDSITIKAALQEIETAFEGLPGGHTQNTDTASGSTFMIGTGGIKLKTTSGVLEVRNNADSAYDDLKALTIEGTTITATVAFSGNLTGNVTGNASGTAATVTGAAQTAITSVGTLTALTVSGAIVPNAVGTIDLGSTSAELRNIFLANGGILYGQIDQSATLTSSLNTWTASNFATTGIMTIGTQLLPDANDGATIGASGTGWSDLFLASSAVIDFNAGDVTLTHSSNTLTLGGGDLALGTNNITGVGYISFGSDPADAGAIRLSNNTFLYSEKASTGTDISVIGVDGSDIVQIAASGSSGVTITPATTITGAATFNGAATFGDADTDSITARSMIIGGNSREVQINASTRTAPTYPSAAPTQDLYVKGNIESPGTVYAASFNTGPGTEGSRGITLTSNTAFTPSADQLYFIGDVFFFSQAGTQKTPMRLEDTQTATGKKTFQGDIAVGDTSNSGSIDIWDGSANTWTIQTGSQAGDFILVLPTTAGTTGQYVKTTTSGSTATLSWDTPSASADTTGGTGGVQFNAAGVLTSDAGFVFTTATDKLSLGSSGGATTGTLDLYYTGTTYAATITPNAGMSADVTITLPDNTSTLIGSGANTFTGSQTLSNASNNSTVNVMSFTGVPAFNASDVQRYIYLAPTGAVLGTITGTGNTFAMIDVPALTGDAETNLYVLRIGALTGTTGSASEVEHAVSIGAGWDRGISSGSIVYIGDGTNSTTISATGSITLAGTATYTQALGNMYLGDTANALSTLGLTINQGANDDEIISLKSSDVAHAVTATTEADTFGVFTKAGATTGGLIVQGITDATADGALTLIGILGTADPTDTHTAIRLKGNKKDGTDGVAALGAAETVFRLDNNATALITVVGSGATTISGNNGDNAFTLLDLVNNDPTTGGETGRTSDLVFSIFGSIAETTNVAHQAAKISAYQVGDFYSSNTADLDAGLKFYTTNNDTPTLALTITNLGLATFAGAVTVSGTLTSTSAALTTPAIGAATGTSLIATGIVDGLTNVTIGTDGTEDANGAGKMSHIIVNKHATPATAFAVTMATPVAGMQLLVKNGAGSGGTNTGVITLVAGANVLIYNPTTKVNCTATQNLVSGGAAGDFVGMVALDTTHWESMGSGGTWACVTP